MSNRKPVRDAAGDLASGFCAAKEATEASSANPQLTRMAMVSRVGTLRGAKAVLRTDRNDGLFE
jgi:hypothetical protein